MKSITPLSKIMMYNYKNQRSRRRYRGNVKKTYRLSKNKFFLSFRTPRTATAVIRFKSKLSMYRNANLFNSTAHYSQSSIVISKPFGFIQQRRKVIHKNYRIIGFSKQKKYIVEKNSKYKKTKNFYK